MYAWVFRHLPGPLWVRILTVVVGIVLVVGVLFEVVFPWITHFPQLGQGATVGATREPTGPTEQASRTTPMHLQ